MAFNIRVYGLLIQDDKVLVSDERRFGKLFTKFPGGGLEFGEGIKDCLIREFDEELGVTVDVGDLCYLTDFFQASAFDSKQQIISVYYYVSLVSGVITSLKNTVFDFDENEQEVHRWVSLSALQPADFLFPIDQLVVKKLLSL